MAAGEVRGRGSSRCTGPKSLTAPEQAAVRVPEASLHSCCTSARNPIRRSCRSHADLENTDCGSLDPTPCCELLLEAHVTS